MHKGYTCLEVSTGRIYISHDVVFDEAVFPFSELHANAGAHLRAEINLLPSTLLPSSNFENMGQQFSAASLLPNDHPVDTNAIMQILLEIYVLMHRIQMQARLRRL
jgi:hypothetical protein